MRNLTTQNIVYQYRFSSTNNYKEVRHMSKMNLLRASYSNGIEKENDNKLRYCLSVGAMIIFISLVFLLFSFIF